MPLCPAVYKTYLPTVVPADPMAKMSLTSGKSKKSSLSGKAPISKKGEKLDKKVGKQGCGCHLM